MKLTAIVVTFNRLAQLQTTLQRLATEALDQIIVVDNASDDGTSDWLSNQEIPHLHVITLPQNTGGAGGFEAGVIYARDHSNPDWLVLMDDDARPLVGAMAQFKHHFSKLDPDCTAPDAVGAIAATVLNIDGTICEMNRPSRNPFWHGKAFIAALKGLIKGKTRGGFHIGDASMAADAPASDIDVASFVGYFIARGAVARVGLPDGGFFIYGDDVTYSLRLRRAGLRILMAPAVQFEHDCGTLSIDLATRPLWKVYYLSRNGVPMARLAAGIWLFPLALSYYVFVWIRKTRYYQPHERSLYRHLMWTGLRDGLLGRRGRNDTAHSLSQTLAPIPRDG